MRDHRMPALRTIALVVIAAWGAASHAEGLGPIRVQSALGQSLRASVPVLNADLIALSASCIKVRLEQPDGSLVMGVQAAVVRSGSNASIQLSTHQPVNEPAVLVNLQVECSSSIQRTYQLLLDPVLSLPHLPAGEVQKRNGNDNKKSRLRDQSMVAPAEDDGLQATSRRTAARRARNEEPASPSAQQILPAPATPKPAVTQQQARKVMRSVLKLSSDDVAIDTGATFSPGLKLSDTLSESRDTGDAQSAAELRKAYDRFSAIMRDEDPSQHSEKQLREMQAKLQELEKQTALLKEKGEQRQVELESVKRDTVSSGWVVVLSGLLIAALGAMAWLYRRMQRLGRRHSAALWEKTVLGQPTERGEWENTFGADDTFAAIDASTGVLTEAKPSDWERGVPLDDTLAVDWASQQATMQTTPAQASSTRRDGPHSAAHRFEPTLVHEVTRDTATARNVRHDSSVTRQEELQESPGKGVSNPVPGKFVPLGASRTAQKIVGQSVAGVPSMEVEEISDLMQEAEFWMLLNDPERAIEMLEPSLQVPRPVSPVPWIYLLDLYRVTQQKEKYRTLAARIKTVFNTNAPAWDQPESETAARSLREYPHVVQMIEDLWEGDGILPYLESLLVDEREGERAGFDLAVYREIVHLIGVARDPKVLRWRGQLNFDNPQARLLSQKVSMPAGGTGKTPASATSQEEAEVFDRATSQQATARQVAATIAASKPEIVALSSAEPPVPASPLKLKTEKHAEATRETAVISKTPAMALEAVPALSESPLPEESASIVHMVPVAPSHSGGQAAAAPEDHSAEDAERMADMARKLDLVLAYQEIGEHVGARVLLEEVIQGGSPLQVEKAKAMLKKLLREIDWQ